MCRPCLGSVTHILPPDYALVDVVPHQDFAPHAKCDPDGVNPPTVHEAPLTDIVCGVRWRAHEVQMFHVFQLEELNLSNNDLGSLGLKHLSQCVGKVRKLDLFECGISGSNMEDLSMKISQLDEPVCCGLDGA